jgi:hypothetical protein
MTWQMDETGIVSGGDAGGSIQVGGAFSVRFVNPVHPRCVVEITVFPSAPEREIKTQEGSAITSHGFGNDMDSLGLDMQTEYVIANEGADMEHPWDDPEWQHTEYESLDTGPFSTVKKAESAARWFLENFDPERSLIWDGNPFHG